MDTQNIDKRIIDELKKSPLFNLSLSSKELFHSNFLAWIGTNHKGIFEDLINNLLERFGCEIDFTGEWEVKREYHNFDLCVINKNEGNIIFILENKVKSIPKLTQLKDYNKKILEYNTKAPDAVKVLLSLATDFPDRNDIENIDWKIISYSDLNEQLTKVIDRFHNDYLQKLVADYCNFIGNLHQLADGWKIKDDLPFLQSPIQDSGNLRISDLQDKLWHSQLIAKLQRELSSMGIDGIKVCSGFDIRAIKEYNDATLETVFINWGFTHGQGLLEAKVKINDRYVLLVQVQGNRYCHGIEWIKAVSGSPSHEEFWEETKREELVRKLSFFQFDEETALFPRIFGNVKMKPMHRKAEGKSRIYNKYGAPFLYQSVKIENETVKDIINAVKEDVQNIIETAIYLKNS